MPSVSVFSRQAHNSIRLRFGVINVFLCVFEQINMEMVNYGKTKMWKRDSAQKHSVLCVDSRA